MLRATSTGAWLAAGTAGLLSVVIPAHNEAETLDATVSMLTTALEAAHIAHEIVVVNAVLTAQVMFLPLSQRATARCVL